MSWSDNGSQTHTCHRNRSCYLYRHLQCHCRSDSFPTPPLAVAVEVAVYARQNWEQVMLCYRHCFLLSLACYY